MKAATRGTSSRRRSLTRTAAGMAAGLTLTLLLGACGASSNPQDQPQDNASAGAGKSIVVGSAAFPESETIAEIYAGALDSAGFKTTTKLSIGQRELYFKAVQDGTVDVVPDYSGNLLLFVDPKATATSAADIMKALPSALPKGLEVLDPAKAEDKDAMVVTQLTAQKYGLKTIGDMAKVCDQLVLGAGPEFAERSYGLPGLKKNYGCVPKKFSKLADSGGPLTVKALLENQVQVADIFTTSPDIIDNDLVVLKDPKDNFIAQQVLPLVKSATVNEKARKALNEVSAKLTTEDLIKLNQKVSGDQKMDPQDAAAQWLKDKGITK